MTRRAAAVLAAVVCVVLGSARADAACTFSATPMAFGAYDVFQASPDDATGTITYRCGVNDHNIRISISTGTSGTYTNRTLKNGAETLQYNLFYGGFTQVWGDLTSGTTIYFENNPPNNKDVVLTVYGRITAGQDVAIGNYTDTVVVTLQY